MTFFDRSGISSIRNTLLLVWAMSWFPGLADAKEVQVTPSELTSAIRTNLPRVSEFHALREEGEKLGVHVYLAGESASDFIHYVKWDVQRLKGDNELQPERFDYDSTSIFYDSSSDLNLVVDGTPAQVKQLRSSFAKKYPYVLGSSQAKLNIQRLEDAEKGAAGLTDSHSAGLIEITDSKAPVVRDLRASNATESLFLSDTVSGKLRFFGTPRVSEPGSEIVDVLRALSHASNYGLVFDPESEKRVTEIIDRFDPKAVTNDSMKQKIYDASKKIVAGANQGDYVWENFTGKYLGLNDRLKSFSSSEPKNSGRTWGFTRPLPSYEVGQGEGATARELGIDLLAHATGATGFRSYEVMTKYPNGVPNLLPAFKASELGSGFYTAVGTHGAMRSTEYNVRLIPLANAREGETADFVFFKKLGYVVVKNRAAFRVKAESIPMTPAEYFKFLNQGGEIPYEDSALLVRYRRKLLKDSLNLTPKDEDSVVRLVRSSLGRENDRVLQEWLNLPISTKHPEIIQEALKTGRFDHALITGLSNRFWSRAPRERQEFVKSLIAKPALGKEIATTLAPLLQDSPGLTRLLIESTGKEGSSWGTLDEVVTKVLAQPHARDFEKLVDLALATGKADAAVAKNILPLPRSANRPDWFESVLKKNGNDVYMREALMAPHWRQDPRWERWAQTAIHNGRISGIDELKSLLAASGGNCSGRFKTLAR